MKFGLPWWLALLLCSALGMWRMPMAHAQTRDPGLRWKRSAAIMLTLSAVSAGAATGLLLSQEPDGFGEGIGLGHAAMAMGYAVDGTLRLLNMVRARRSRRPVAAGPASVLGPVNVATNGLLTAAGILMFSLAEEPSVRGAGLTFAVHGTWLTTFSIVQWVRARRGRPPWMALTPSGLRF